MLRKTLAVLLSLAAFAAVTFGAWFTTSRGVQDGRSTTTPDSKQTSTSDPGPGQSGPSETSQPGTTVNPGSTGDNNTGSGVPGEPNPFYPLPEGVANTFPEPGKHEGLIFRAADLLSYHKVSPLAASRVLAYVTAAILDVRRTAAQPGVISNAGGGGTDVEAIAASAKVLIAISDVPAMVEDIKTWKVIGTVLSDRVAQDIIAQAKTDGYAEAANTKAPSFKGANTWKQLGILANANEPGWGSLRPLLIKAERCPVAKPNVDAINSERTGALAQVAADTPSSRPFADAAQLTGGMNPVVLTMLSVGNNARDAGIAPDEVFRRIGLSMISTYDLTIATWKAKWTYGVASPLDQYEVAKGLTEAESGAPSYPSMISAVRSLLIETGKLNNFTTDWTTTPLKTDPYGSLAYYDKFAASRILNWTIDVEAGEKLGACFALLTSESK